MDETDKDDRVKGRLLACAEACLAHARAVQFGRATAFYDHPDGDLRFSINIEVAVTRIKKEAS